MDMVCREVREKHSHGEMFALDSVDKISLGADLAVARDAVRLAMSLELPFVPWDDKIFDEWFQSLPSDDPLQF
jgi:hypothetical protein